MDKKKTHIDVKVSIQGIRDSLRKRIVSDHSDIITDAIMKNLEKSPRGLEQLYKAFSGVKDEPKFKPGDKVYADLSYLNTWKFDKDKTDLAGLIVNKRLLSLVTAVDIHAQYVYEVTSEARDGADQPVKVVSQINEENLVIEEEWPADDGLPF